METCRVTSGEQTACAAACTTGAIRFGQRLELIAEGEERVAALRQAKPDAVLYGVNELEGLHVMYVLDDKPEAYGLPVDPEVPAAVTVRDVFKSVGLGAAVVAVLGFGFNYLVTWMRMSRGERE